MLIVMERGSIPIEIRRHLAELAKQPIDPHNPNSVTFADRVKSGLAASTRLYKTSLEYERRSMGQRLERQLSTPLVTHMHPGEAAARILAIQGMEGWHKVELFEAVLARNVGFAEAMLGQSTTEYAQQLVTSSRQELANFHVLTGRRTGPSEVAI